MSSSGPGQCSMYPQPRCTIGLAPTKVRGLHSFMRGYHHYECGQKLSIETVCEIQFGYPILALFFWSTLFNLPHFCTSLCHDPPPTPPFCLSALQTVNSQGVGVQDTYIKPACYTIPVLCVCAHYMCMFFHVAYLWAVGLHIA